MNAVSKPDKGKLAAAKRAAQHLEAQCGEKVRILHVEAGRRAKTGDLVPWVHLLPEMSGVAALVEPLK